MSDVRDLIRGLRDGMSADAWHILQGIEDELEAFDLKVEEDEIGRVVETLNRLTVGFVAFSGVVAESMTRGQAWRFLDIGMRIERAIAVGATGSNNAGRNCSRGMALLDAVSKLTTVR